MSANHNVSAAVSGRGALKTVMDAFNWTSYSSLHKWLIVSLAILAISWQFSLWTLVTAFLAASFAGVKLSEEILHNKRASHIAELLFYKLESGYIEIRAFLRQLNAALSGNQHEDGESTLPAHLITELSYVCDSDADRSSDGSIPVKLSPALKMELNSIQLLIIRDFVRSWYADFSYDPQFLKETKYYLQQAFNSLVIHVAQQDPQILLAKVIKLYQSHFSLYQKACNTFESHKVHPTTKVLIDPRFKRHSSVDDAFETATILHPALESETVELSYLKGVVSVIVLSACSHHVIDGPCVKTLLVQILTNKVMFPVMKIMSNPDWLMEVIIILTSDEKVSDKEASVSSVEGNKGCANENEKTVSVHNDIKQLSLGQQDLDRTGVSQSHKHLSVSELHKSNLQSETKDTHVTVTADKCHKVYDTDACLASEHHFEQSTPSVLSSLNSETVDFKHSQTDMQQDPTSDMADQESVTFNPLFASSSTDSLASIVHNTEDTQLDTDYVTFENYNSPEERDECFVEDEPDANIFFGNHFSLESDPQKIMSYRHRSSPSSSDSDLCSSMGHSTEGSSLHPETDTSSETITSSFPKLSSLKNFFVGKQQQFVKKPRSLSLISEKLAMNLNPLTHKRLEKTKSNGHHSQHPPQLLVDGIPLDNQSVRLEDSQVSTVASRTEDQSTLTLCDVVTTPSPGFFSSVNSFFTMSLSQNDMSKLCESEKPSPAPTPSPTGQAEFGTGTFAIIKDSSDLRPIDTDDRRIFQDVTIPETSVNNEFRSSTQYSLYNIEYEALYFTEEGKSVIRSGNVRRRYREFLSLQSRLESHPGYKKYLKNIKGPKRWPTIPFKSIDKETVETRRLFLERYLKDLIEIEAICNGPDMREFLAYEGDSHIAFVKKSPDISVPRFDKMLMRGVSEVVDRIKALPNIPQEVMSGLRGRETPDEKPVRSRNQLDSDSIDVNTAYSMDMISETSNVLPMSSLQILQDLDTEDDKDLIHSVITDPRNIEQQNEAYKQEVETVLSSLPRIQGDGVELNNEKAATSETVNLSLAVLDLLVEGLQESDHWICRERVVKSMHAVLEKALNRYLENSISSLTSEPRLVSYIKRLRETIWPQGQLWSSSHTVTTEDQRAATRERAKQCLINFFPVSLRLVIGYQEFDRMISHFLSSLESEKLNRHILYTILDMLVEQLFPEVTSHDLLQGLFFSRSRSTYLP